MKASSTFARAVDALNGSRSRCSVAIWRQHAQRQWTQLALALLVAASGAQVSPSAAAEQPREIAPESRGAASFFVLRVGEPYVQAPQGAGAVDPQLVTLGGLWSRYGSREWVVRLDAAACDLAGLQAGLAADSARRDAFAAVLGWPLDEVPARLGRLRAGYLQSHLDVINHGYSAGEAFASERRLAEGTAVLIDANGVPVVRCACGNPLLSLAPQDEPPLPAQLADGGELSPAPTLGEVDETPLAQGSADKGVGQMGDEGEQPAPDADTEAEPDPIDPAEVLEDLLSQEEPAELAQQEEQASGDAPLAQPQAPPVPTGGMIGEFPEEELPLPLAVVVVALLPIAADLEDGAAGGDPGDDDFMDGIGGTGDSPPDDGVILPPPSVPLPAAGWLFAGALLLLGWGRARASRGAH